MSTLQLARRTAKPILPSVYSKPFAVVDNTEKKVKNDRIIL